MPHHSYTPPGQRQDCSLPATLLKPRTLQHLPPICKDTRLPVLPVFVDMADGFPAKDCPSELASTLNAKFVDTLYYRTYVLMGDGESVEGSVWEAAEVGRHYALDNLCAIIDINRLVQSDPTMLQHDMEAYRSRWTGFDGMRSLVDGHDLAAVLSAFDEAARTKGRPTVSRPENL